MKFVDQITIRVRAGDGGGGLASFRREKYIPRGGPDGGDGGNGGQVYLRADTGLNHLGRFTHQRSFSAANGAKGMTRCSSGANGGDLYIDVPPGTIVHDADTDELISELLRPGDSLLVARGGHRGFGNPHFKSSVNRAPRRATPGTSGEARSLRLELRVLADAGLIGKPNAGKSSLLNRLTNAQAKVGDYIFTTIHPVLGVVREEYDEDFRATTVADIPGLIEGASRGEGLGYYFLRHILRTRLLLHLVDIGSDSIADDIEEVENNLYEYDARLRGHPRWLVLSKSDSLDEETVAERIKELRGQSPLPCYSCSASSGAGVADLAREMAQALDRQNQS